MSHVVLDDHLLRDVLSAEKAPPLESLVSANDIATTNLYYVRLCRSVIAARGGKLTGGWSIERRRDLGQRLLELPKQLRLPSILVPRSAFGMVTTALGSAKQQEQLASPTSRFRFRH